MYRNRTAALPQQFQAPGPKTAPAYGSCFEHRHAFQQRLIEEQRRQLQKQQELILELQENQRLSRAKEEAAQATAITQQLNNSASQTREEKQSRCKNTTHLRYTPSIKQAQLVSLSHSYSCWATICQAYFSHAGIICSSSHLWLCLKGSIRLPTVLHPSLFLQWLDTMWSIQDPLRNSNTSVTHSSSRDLFSWKERESVILSISECAAALGTQLLCKGASLIPFQVCIRDSEWKYSTTKNRNHKACFSDIGGRIETSFDHTH